MHGTAPVPNEEIEVKLELAPASVPALKTIPLFQASKATPKRADQISVYFDTNKQKLRKKGLMLRVRREGRRYLQTIKSNRNSGIFQRDEWETEVAGKEPDLSKATGTALEPLLSNKLRRHLKPLFETRVRRTVYPIVDGAHSIAVSVDRGTIDTGKRSQPLCEIELELERGNAAELFNVARKISQALPARLAVKSKSERGYEIIKGEEDLPVKAQPVDLTAGASARDAFKMIGLACLKQIICNEPALLNGDPEGVHQMRVGLRRLRAAMSLFAVILPDAQSEGIKTELKWLTRELGPARELEVLFNRVVAPMKRRGRRWHGMPSLSQELAERRNVALARAQDWGAVGTLPSAYN
jgi:triphosphatase